MNRLRYCLQNSARASWSSRSRLAKTLPDETWIFISIFGTNCNLYHQYLISDSMSSFMLKDFRAMANIKPQSSLTQQQGM